MVKRTIRGWSMLTCFVLLGMLVSVGFAHPAVAHPIVTEEIESDTSAHHHLSDEIKATLKDGTFNSYQEPDEIVLANIARAQLGPDASQAEIESAAAQYLAEWHASTYHGPDPQAYQKLLQNEQRALTANSSPAAMGLDVSGTLRLFTVAVEFAGSDSVTDFVHPISVADRTCVTETLTFEGPLHGEIAEPGPRDNYSLWLPEFDNEYYEKLISSEEGITERVRPDLIDPEDGQAGIDISGMTMRNYFDEASGGRVDFDTGPAGVIAWLQVPHSEAYYAANACTLNAETGEYEAGRIQSMNGLPTNPKGTDQLVADIIEVINADDPNFPWDDYDMDGDGIIDHVVFIHAGEDRARGGPYTAFWAHRGSVSLNDDDFVADDQGTPSPDDDIRFAGYTMQYEALDLGVLVHEFGHDLGYPDLYDTSGEGESDVVWWDLMSTGSNLGKIGGFPPTGLSAWTKFALGWTDPEIIEPGTTPQDVVLGQSSNPPAGTTQAVRVNLPDTEVVYTEPQEGSTQTWWTNNDQDWADLRLTRDVDLTGATAPISISFDIDYIIEEDWDYMFLEVSMDGGTTFTQTRGLEVGTDEEITTPNDYADPNGRLSDYGGLQYGYTGSSTGWLRAYHDLSDYAGEQIKVRFRQATDAGFLERGAYIDNIAITAADTEILNDPVENDNANGWTATVENFSPGPLGEGWIQSDGTVSFPKYYLIEWRNLDGFDKGLQYTYNTILSEETAEGGRDFQVDIIPSNVPGMLVWVRDTRFGNEPFGADNSILNADNQFGQGPSEGAKGGLLVVDAHAEPLRGPRNSTITTDFGTYEYPPGDNWRGRVQTTNAAFTLDDTPEISVTLASGVESAATTVYTSTVYAPKAGLSGFHDALGYYPGVEELPEPVKTFEGEFGGDFFLRLKPYAFSDPDASVVIPAKEYYSPRTPAGFTGEGAETSPPSVNVSTLETIFTINEAGSAYPNDVSGTNVRSVNVGAAGEQNIIGAQTGNPGSTNVQYGYHFEIVSQAANGSSGVVRLSQQPFKAKPSGSVTFEESVTTIANLSRPAKVNASMRNVGGKGPLVLYSDFDEATATYISSSATSSAIPVNASLAETQAAFESGGIEGVKALQSSAADATAIVWVGEVDSGVVKTVNYQLTRATGAPNVQVTNTAFGAGFAESEHTQLGITLSLPIVAR
ncbi:MAG: hypothetical protein GFH27_549285n321 [Chloroflexi bacterium AL-W]|nr:hypothetical protein [Chloroflexi bacterium AL-N1]NOK65832.1 hypothetical protein [Chloroflexi bacterium AL-N10]NOK74227.1 hypothetical protein [Chloroflexi bacterium AL-N5]NOK80865.1 hypothetical protein [Chloroflexi bacterium AL-W]NOK88485.1 hypothetical protein [Chloroflexi bacterium AL-N15]